MGTRLETLEDVVARVGARDGAVRLTGLRGAARAVAIAHLVRAHGERPALVLVPTSKACDAALLDLRAALGEDEGGGRVRAFPRHDTQPYERFSPQPFLVAQRMDVLYRWLATPPADAKRAARTAGAAAHAQGAARRTKAEPLAHANGAEPAPVVVAPWT